MENKLKSPETVEKRRCTFCSSQNILENSNTGELVCNQCGGVIEEDLVEQSASRRAFNFEERQRKKRTGSPITYTKHHRGIVTRIGTKNMDKMSADKRGRYHRMKKWDRRLSGSKPRNMRLALSEMQRIIDDLKLPSKVHEEAARLYEKAWEKEVVKGRRVEDIVAASVFLVCRMQNIPRTLDEISDAAEIERTEVGRNYRYLARELDKRVIPARPEDFLPRFASYLDLSGTVRGRAHRIIKQIREKSLMAGRSPEGVVASSLYISAVLEDEKRSQKEIAEAVGVTEVTIRKGYREFAEELGLLEELEERREI